MDEQVGRRLVGGCHDRQGEELVADGSPDQIGGERMILGVRAAARTTGSAAAPALAEIGTLDILRRAVVPSDSKQLSVVLGIDRAGRSQGPLTPRQRDRLA